MDSPVNSASSEKVCVKSKLQVFADAHSGRNPFTKTYNILAKKALLIEHKCISFLVLSYLTSQGLSFGVFFSLMVRVGAQQSTTTGGGAQFW